MPQQIRQTVFRWFSPAAEITIRKTMAASGFPKDKTKLVTMMKMGPRVFTPFSFVASLAEVLELNE
jgi:hypothetical protein